MSRQIQIRRGTANEHTTFIGADGEITVDTTNHTLRIHDGITPGGHTVGANQLPDNIDYVVEWQTPTAENNYTWYRKYASGWIEQGGLVIGGAPQTVNMAITMQNTNYSCIISSEFTSSSNDGACTFGIMSGSKTTTSFVIAHNAYLDWKPYGCEWVVRGMTA